MNDAPPDRPLVSVIVPTFNRAALVGEALDSVFAQTYRPVELLVIDDGSADETPAVVRRWLAAHPDDGAAGWAGTLIEQPNAGACAARNRGLAESRGELVQFFDSDDLMHPGKLAAQVAAFASTPGAGYVWSDLAFFRGTPDWARAPWASPPEPDARPLAAHLAGRLTQTGNGLYAADVLDAVGGWDEALVCGDDWALNARVLLELERAGRPCVYVPGTCELLRSHDAGRLLNRMGEARGLREQLAATAAVRAELTGPHAPAADPGLRGALRARYGELARHAARIGAAGALAEVLAAARAAGCALDGRTAAAAAGWARLPGFVRRGLFRAAGAGRRVSSALTRRAAPGGAASADWFGPPRTFAPPAPRPAARAEPAGAGR